jgi:hypothetical protein
MAKKMGDKLKLKLKEDQKPGSKKTQYHTSPYNTIKDTLKVMLSEDE